MTTTESARAPKQDSPGTTIIIDRFDYAKGWSQEPHPVQVDPEYWDQWRQELHDCGFRAFEDIRLCPDGSVPEGFGMEVFQRDETFLALIGPFYRHRDVLVNGLPSLLALWTDLSSVLEGAAATQLANAASRTSRILEDLAGLLVVEHGPLHAAAEPFVDEAHSPWWFCRAKYVRCKKQATA